MTEIKTLKNSYKGAYPFKLGTTSFIYPADWCTNARLLGPYVDEIELLFLESVSVDSFPSPTDIRTLATLACEHGITYNIHLPSDISLGAREANLRETAIDVVCRVITLAAELDPSTWTLHLPYPRSRATRETTREWRGHLRHGLETIVDRSGLPPEKLSIESLFYPYEWIGDLVRELHLSVCFDTGHLMLKGYDLKKFYADYGDLVSIIHLHGVDGETDHISLDRFSSQREQEILSILEGYTGTVSVEVFSFSDIASSLEWLRRRWR